MSVQQNCDSEIEDTTVGAEKLPNPKYEVFMDASSQYRFHLRAANGQIIATSEGYETKQGSMHGIDAVQRSCDAKIEDLTTGQIVESEKKECPVPSGDEGTTTLEMSCPPASVDLNSIVTFEGKLTDNKTCEGIADADITIYEKDRSFMSDDVIVKGMTGKDGTFKIDWKAKQLDWWDDSVELYGKFEGTEEYQPSVSPLYKIRVLFYLGKKY